MIQNLLSNLVHQSLLAYKYYFPPKNLNINHIDLNIWLGSLPYNNDCFKKLKARNIKHIFSIMTEDEIKNISFDKDFNQVIIPILDCDGPKIEDFEEAVDKIIDLQRNEPDKNIYIHCFFGKGRSSSVAVAYLMKKYEISLDKAVKRVKYSNPITHINYKQNTSLQKFEKYLKDSKNKS